MYPPSPPPTFVVVFPVWIHFLYIESIISNPVYTPFPSLHTQTHTERSLASFFFFVWKPKVMYLSEQLGKFHATCKSAKNVTNLRKMWQKSTIAQIVDLIQVSNCSENCVHCLLFLENSLQGLKKEMHSFTLWYIQEFHFYPVTLFIWEHAVNQQDKVHFRNLAK